MKSYYDSLKEDIGAYEGRHDEYIYLAPEWYRLMTNLLDNPRLPGRLRPLVVSAIAYFIMPVDVIPEETYGPYGYIDDIWFCAFVAGEIAERTGDRVLISESWDGEGDVLALMEETLGREEELIGDLRERILKYTGCGELLAWLDAGTRKA
jgi:uncharacterized membrane protein YkvA (DUF1232 family)